MLLRATSQFRVMFPINKCLKILYLAVILLILVGTLLILKLRMDKIYCCYHPEQQIFALMPPKEIRWEQGDFEPLDDVLVAYPKPISGRTIFFLETSNVIRQEGNNIIMDTSKLQFRTRQACAIESAALHNPNYQIYVLFARPTYRSVGSQDPLINALLQYRNVNLRQLNVWNYVADTPVEKWFNRGDFFKSSYPIHHLSDLLRILTLYRYGGIYLDSDVMVLRSLEELPLNFIGAESTKFLANGVVSMTPDGFGHDIATTCLQEFQKTFEGAKWGFNGPELLTRVMSKICETSNVTLMHQDEKRCKGFKVFDTQAFYAIKSTEWINFFNARRINETIAETRDSYMIHIWNKMSHYLSFKVGSNTFYGKYAEQHCPKSYASAGDYF